MARPASVPRLAASGMSKSFAGTAALTNVDLELFGGEMLALVGANGAGKSTLVKIVCGALAPDAGRIAIDGTAVNFTSVGDALAAGIAVAHQQVSIISPLTGAQNVMLGREPVGGGLIRPRTLTAQAQALADRFGVEIDLSRECTTLGLGEKKILDILKALAREPSVLILDEPTASLTLNESRRLFRFLRDLKVQGLGILFISHHLNEVFEQCDRVVVLKDGRKVHDGAVGEITREAVVLAMVGRTIEATDWTSHARSRNVAVTVDDLRIGPLLVPQLRVHAGEVVGIAGVLGAGQTHLLERLAGLAHPTGGGAVRLGTLERLPRNVGEALDSRIYLIADDRKRNAIFPGLSIEENLASGSLAQFSRAGFIRSRQALSSAETIITQLKIKCRSATQDVTQLSGGNQQKVAFGRWLTRMQHNDDERAPIFLLDNPTEGVDVGSKAEIYALIRDAAQRGAAILLCSSDFAELTALCDRIYCIANGVLGAPLLRAALSEDRLLLEVS